MLSQNVISYLSDAHLISILDKSRLYKLLVIHLNKLIVISKTFYWKCLHNKFYKRK